MTTTPQAALLREAAQNALITLDGIASANPRDKADFETPDEWIAWAKSRARFAADALRAPVAQEVYAERILRQMLHESDQTQSMQAEPVQAGELPDEREAFEAWFDAYHSNACAEFGGIDCTNPKGVAEDAWQARASLAARKPLMPTDAQVTAAAKALCDEFAADCNVDRDDSWMIHGEEFKDSARRALIAAHGIGLEVKTQ